MKREVQQLTTENHERSAAMAAISEKSSTTERNLREQNEVMDRKNAELQVRFST